MPAGPCHGTQSYAKHWGSHKKSSKQEMGMLPILHPMPCEIPGLLRPYLRRDKEERT